MTNSRKARGMKTQALVAEWLATRGFPFATDAGAGRQGRDILNTIGLAIEVKARRDLSLPAWLRQAVKTAAGDIPAVIHRPDGFGEASMADWPVTMRLEDWTRLVRAAGYGDPEAASGSEVAA
jgi:hypothetical protein